MGKKISSLEELKVKLSESRQALQAEMVVDLTKGVLKVQEHAKSKFGHYQMAVGPFPEWEDLNYQYAKEKMKAGSPGDDPLIGHYGDGESNKVYPDHLRNTIMTEVKDFKGYVGTNDPLGKWHEFGYSKWNVNYPPRPFLRPALYENREFIKKLFAESLAKALLSRM